jgi:hypothetical protein
MARIPYVQASFKPAGCSVVRAADRERTNFVVTGMRTVRTVLLVLVTIAALAAFPAAAVARPGFVVHKAHEEVTFPGQAGEGWSVFIDARSPHQATVIVEDATGTEGVTYELPALVKGNRLEIHYGQVIDVSVRFRPRSRRLVPELPHEHCTGRRPVILSGVFVGTIELNGELGYADLDESSHKGTLERTPRQVCRRSRPARAAAYDEAPVEQLVAERAEGRSETFFAAISNFPTLIPHPRWSFEAARFEQDGPVKITRQVGLELETGATFSTEEAAPPIATVEPPPPFAGSAEYRGGPGSATWAGSLAVDFPGLPPLPLTGRGFTTHFCVGEGRAARPCERSPLALGLL